MKKNKLIYWIATGVFAAMMMLSGSMYFTKEIAENFAKIGFPNSFRIELGIAKLIGAIVLIVPFFKGYVKEWAYAGFGITLVSAVILHVSMGDPIGNAISPIVFLGILALSHLYYHRLQNQN